MSKGYETSRANKPVQSALSDLGTKYNLDPDSLNVYLKDARKLMEISDAALALEVNDERQRLQSQGAADPLNSALELTASKMGLPLGLLDVVTNAANATSEARRRRSGI